MNWYSMDICPHFYYCCHAVYQLLLGILLIALFSRHHTLIISTFHLFYKWGASQSLRMASVRLIKYFSLVDKDWKQIADGPLQAGSLAYTGDKSPVLPVASHFSLFCLHLRVSQGGVEMANDISRRRHWNELGLL